MKLGTKLLAAPLLTAAVVLLSGQLNVWLMGRASDAALTSTKTSLEDFKTFASAQQQMGQVHASVYRTVSIIGSLDEGKVKAFRADLAKQLDGVKRVVGAVVNTSAADQELHASVAKLNDLIDKYKKQTDNSVEIAAGDPLTGITSMTDAEQTYVSLSSTMAGAVQRIESTSDTAEADA
jgi:methyl-accepting chemotaxis protein